MNVSLNGPLLKSKISVAFPKALPNDVLVKKVSSALIKYGYGKTTLLASSLCCDELARPLEKDFQRAYGEHFTMGGLAGFPFGGVTGFGAMAHHIPDGGSCLVVYGPHVGVDSYGTIGTVERRGRAKGGACCGSAAAACGYVTKVHNGESKKIDAPNVCLDAQQAFVGSMLLPYAKRVVEAKETQVELPMALFDAQKELMSSIIKMGAGAVAGQGKIALVGGIQINTPPEMSDFFLPLQFDIFDNRGCLIESISID
jgi:hypothetical protein